MSPVGAIATFFAMQIVFGDSVSGPHRQRPAPCVRTAPMPALKPPTRFTDSMPVFRVDSGRSAPMPVFKLVACF